jgi:hypothetical protein
MTGFFVVVALFGFAFIFTGLALLITKGGQE